MEPERLTKRPTSDGLKSKIGPMISTRELDPESMSFNTGLL